MFGTLYGTARDMFGTFVRKSLSGEANFGADFGADLGAHFKAEFEADFWG